MSNPTTSRRLTVALDWTPNTNHTGFYVAKAKGWFAEEGLDVIFKSPSDFEGSYSGSLSDDAAKVFPTPCHSVASGQADFGINSPEGCVGWNSPEKDSTRKTKLVAVAALLQKQTSAIVTLKSSGIDRPAKLDGKVYASYAARYEGRIVQKLIQADGGSGDYKEVPHPFLKVWDLLKEGDVDATWVFMGWEGVEARLKGVELNAFYLNDYDIPYAPSPVMMANPDLINSEPATVKAFLRAAARGYEFAALQTNVQEAAEILLAGAKAENNAELDTALVHASQKQLSENNYYLDDNGKWGRMTENRWSKYLDWLSDSKLLTTFVQSRAPVSGVSTSLDGLRNGNSGDIIPREKIDAKDLFVDLF